VIGRLATPMSVGCNIFGISYDWICVGKVSSEPQPLDSVYRSSWLALTRLAYLLVGDRGEAEDIVQTVFTSAVARWEAIDDPAAYLRRAVVNRASDAHRRSYRKPAPNAGVTECVGEPEVDELWALVSALPAPQRAVVVLRFYEDLALSDIATLLDRPASTVRSDLRRALTKLRELLA
jgi:RNA polymerase sigma factor (sigma-70 family)